MLAIFFKCDHNNDVFNIQPRKGQIVDLGEYHNP